MGVLSTYKHDRDLRNAAIAWLEKQDEQKLFDYKNATIIQKNSVPKEDVEHKFYVGDWLVEPREGEPNGLWHIERIENGFYCNGKYGVKIDVADRDYHLWTIEDAIEGDVLAANDGFIMIVKESKDSRWGWRLTRHCALIANKEFQAKELHTNPDLLYPATKEQHDLLFQKMKEAGYEWDDKKKRLIKAKITKQPLKLYLQNQFYK